MTVLDLLAQQLDGPEVGFTPDLPGDTRAALKPRVALALRVVAEALEGPNREEMARWVLDRYLAPLPRTEQTYSSAGPNLPAQRDEVRPECERAETFPGESLRRQFGLAACETLVGSSWRDWG